MEEEHYIIVEQDGSMTNGGMKTYLQEKSYDLPHETTEEVDHMCFLLESRLI